MDEKPATGAASAAQKTCFLVMFKSEAGERMVRVVIESLRAFGGPLCASPVWAFVIDPDRAAQALPGIEGVDRIPLALEAGFPSYPFAEKVYACTWAEEMAGPEIRSLVWLSLDCLIVNPPLLFDLGYPSGEAPTLVAFRPVHHQNVGSPAGEPPDDFWKSVYQALGVKEMPYTVESFVDRQALRPYFNTHCFAFDPTSGLARDWWDHFEAMIADEVFQAGPCSDELHRVFLHQAVLSTLVASRLDWERVRVLPPEYNYPLNLLSAMPEELRAPALNQLVNAVYEDAFPWDEIAVREPLRSWLLARLPGAYPKAA